MIPPLQEFPAKPDPTAFRYQDEGWIALVSALIVVVSTAFLWLTPSGFWGKINSIGYALCHQIPSHSLFLHDHQFPFCARCTGMHLGTLIGLIFTWRQGRRQSFPKAWVWLIYGFFFLSFAFDGVNSGLGLIPGVQQLYPSQNWLRLATGLGTGLVMGSLLAVAFNQTIWALPDTRRIFERSIPFWTMLLVALLFGLSAYFGGAVLKTSVMLLSALQPLATLTIIYSVPAALLLKRQNRISDWRGLCLPVLMGNFAAIFQISVMVFIRYRITGTFIPFNL